MMPRLVGEEAIQAANRIAVGTGSLSREDSKTQVDAWRRSAVPDGEGRQTLAGVMHLMAKSGVGVRLVPKKPRPTTDG